MRVSLPQVPNPNHETRSECIDRVRSPTRNQVEPDRVVLPELWNARYISFER